jgi:hypothetical protein
MPPFSKQLLEAFELRYLAVALSSNSYNGKLPQLSLGQTKASTAIERGESFQHALAIKLLAFSVRSLFLSFDYRHTSDPRAKVPTEFGAHGKPFVLAEVDPVARGYKRDVGVLYPPTGH